VTTGIIKKSTGNRENQNLLLVTIRNPGTRQSEINTLKEKKAGYGDLAQRSSRAERSS
jgi:hypothetical protein